MKLDLYIDFDGVILNTIDITYKHMDAMGISIKDADFKLDYYRNIDWYKLLEESKPIENSLDNIKKLMESDLYNVSILSHVISPREANAKRQYLAEKLPNLNLITVDITEKKCDVVDCKNAILVDDYMGNLELWDAKGGIAIKFSDKGKKYNFITISNLNMLFDKYEDILEIIEMKNNI